jgi:DNA adenine methylase
MPVAARAPLRWAGSKRKLLPVLQLYLGAAPYNRYVEAFAGSAALFFAAEPQCALLNDRNAELILALRFLRKHPRLLHEHVSSLPISRDFYYQLRAVDPRALDPCERAGRFFYLNRYCFNGIYRTNKKGEFNVPFAPIKSGKFPSQDEWVATSNVLQGATLHCEDFEGFLLGNVREGDFVYLDPPYAVSNRRIFSQYSADNFGIGDLERLSVVLRELDSRGARFLVSYAQSPETHILAEGWHVRRTYAQRNVAGFTHHRRKAMEVMISNCLPATR